MAEATVEVANQAKLRWRLRDAVGSRRARLLIALVDRDGSTEPEHTPTAPLELEQGPLALFHAAVYRFHVQLAPLPMKVLCLLSRDRNGKLLD